MANCDKVATVTDLLSRELSRMWLSEPQEVQRLKQEQRLAGAFDQKGSLLLYSNAETTEIQFYIFYLKSMAKADEVSIGALASVAAKFVESKADQWRRYYGMHETPSLMEEAAVILKTVHRKEDFLSIADGLSLYLGRLSVWLDSTIPWSSVCSVIDWHLK